MSVILLIGGQKGGGGKTTTAVSLAVLRKRAGRDVMLVDGDPQKSASVWAMRRGEMREIAVRVPCISLYGRGLADEVLSLATKYDDLVIDVGGHKSEEFLTAMRVANRLLTPVRASQFDLDTMLDVQGLVRMMRAVNPALDASWFINQAPSNPGSRVSAINGARQVLSDLGELRSLRSHLCNRVAFELTGTGIVIDEAPISDSQRKGVWELKQLYQEAWA